MPEFLEKKIRTLEEDVTLNPVTAQQEIQDMVTRATTIIREKFGDLAISFSSQEQYRDDLVKAAVLLAEEGCNLETPNSKKIMKALDLFFYTGVVKSTPRTEIVFKDIGINYMIDIAVTLGQQREQIQKASVRHFVTEALGYFCVTALITKLTSNFDGTKLVNPEKLAFFFGIFQTFTTNVEQEVSQNYDVFIEVEKAIKSFVKIAKEYEEYPGDNDLKSLFEVELAKLQETTKVNLEKLQEKTGLKLPLSFPMYLPNTESKEVMLTFYKILNITQSQVYNRVINLFCILHNTQVSENISEKDLDFFKTSLQKMAGILNKMFYISQSKTSDRLFKAAFFSRKKYTHTKVIGNSDGGDKSFDSFAIFNPQKLLLDALKTKIESLKNSEYDIDYKTTEASIILDQMNEALIKSDSMLADIVSVAPSLYSKAKVAYDSTKHSKTFESFLLGKVSTLSMELNSLSAKDLITSDKYLIKIRCVRNLLDAVPISCQLRKQAFTLSLLSKIYRLVIEADPELQKLNLAISDQNLHAVHESMGEILAKGKDKNKYFRCLRRISGEILPHKPLKKNGFIKVVQQTSQDEQMVDKSQLNM